MSTQRSESLMKHIFMVLCVCALSTVAYAEYTEQVLSDPVPTSATFQTILLGVLAPFAYILTEAFKSLPTKWKPLVPFSVGVIAAVAGHFVYGLDPMATMTAFFAALASGNFAGIAKYVVPAVTEMLKKRQQGTEGGDPGK